VGAAIRRWQRRAERDAIHVESAETFGVREASKANQGVSTSEARARRKNMGNVDETEDYEVGYGKGTGKSNIYAEFSPHGMLISGSEVTSPKLFVSNASGKIGLVGFWDCICFDEFAGKDKKVDKALVDIMKNYMANRTFSRALNS
jgi:hypothetical protein